MQRKLGSYVIAAFIVNVFAIMSVGGLCIMKVRDMVESISRLEVESGKASKLYDVNSKTQDAIFLVHNAILEQDRERILYAIDIIEDVEQVVALYKGEEAAGDLPHNTKEVLLLAKVQDNLTGIIKILQPVYDRTAPPVIEESAFKRMERYGYNVQKLTRDINKVHFEIIGRLVQGSYHQMYFILFLYLVSSLVGILASCVGYVVLRRNTITPIIDLASATEKIASGDLAVRVDTESETEIGVLYDSFNVMTEKLQEHEKRREDFSRELERLVAERTAELQASEESLRRTQSELVRMEKIATLGQIATTVNHEIKTPLNALYMNLQLLNRKINKCAIKNATAKQDMLNITSIIDNEITRINEIIEEFVKYARFPPPDMREDDLNPIVRDLGEMISQSARENEVNVELALDQGLPRLMVDRKKLIQALLNLAMNAIQAMPYGGSLRLSSRREGGEAVIAVADTGKGIAAEDLERIFDPFFTKKDGGLGFGLAVVQRIIEDHKGTISCRSEEGRGTIFEIRLPLAP